MTDTEIQTRLAQLRRWQPGMTLEPFEWLTEDGPLGAFDELKAYQLLNAPASAPRGAAWQAVTPVLVIGPEVLVGPGPALLDEVVRRANVFARSAAFSDDLLFQMHRFALESYEGCQVREEQVLRGAQQFTIRGQAYRGAGARLEALPFETHVHADAPATFTLQPAAPAGGPVSIDTPAR